MNIFNINQRISIPKANDMDIKKMQAEQTEQNKTELETKKSEVISTEPAIPMCCTVVETDIVAVSDLLEKEEESKDNEESLEYTKNHMTEEDCEQLEKEGYAIEQFEAERLEKALVRRKENQQLFVDTIDTHIENKKEFREDIEKIIINNKISDPMAKKMAQKLMDANLPVTEANIEAMLSAMKFSSVIPKLSENGMASMIGKEIPITLENIYKNQYSAIKMQGAGEEVWKEIKSQAKEILISSGIEGNEQNMEKAKWLFDHNLPISENTFDTYNSLLQLRNDFDEDMLLTKMTEAMKRGFSPEQADLNIQMSEKIEQAVVDFKAITNEAVDKVLANGEKLDLVHLKQAQHELEQEEISNNKFRNIWKKADSVSFNGYNENMNQTTKNGNTKEIVVTDSNNRNTNNSSDITAYRQLEEIRLKLTLESAQNLAKKGIRVDTSELQKIVDGLKEMERQYYENLLEERNAEKTEANISILKATTETVTSVKSVPVAVLGSTLKANISQNIDTLYEQGMELKASYDKAGTAYETLMTAPRKDMGDSIQKAFQNVDAILEDLDMEITADNQRAVRILGYNRMEINETSITAIKAYDSQVSSLLNELHPAACVELIKKGINPLDMPMQQLIHEVKGIKEEIGVTDKEKYSTYLWKLDKQNAISEEERKSYIGIYRLLNNVEKTDGAAIGAVLDTGKELTMGNLLTAVRTMKHKGVNVEVNDKFGAVESLTFQKETITEQIEAGISNKVDNKMKSSFENQDNINENQMIYQKNVLDTILEEISPEKLHEITNGNLEQLFDMSLEQLKEQILNVEEDRELQYEYLQEKVENIKNIIENSKEAVGFLEQFHQPVSIYNLEVVSKYFTGNKNLFKELKDKADNLNREQKETVNATLEDLSNSIEDVDTLQQKYKQLEKEVEQLLNKCYEDSTLRSGEIKELQIFSRAIALTGSMSRQQHYEIPIVTGDTVTNVSLTIRTGNNEKGKLQITTQSEQYGRIEIEASIKEKAINGLILCETKEGIDTLKSCQKEMVASLEKLGLNVNQLSIAISGKALDGLKTTEENASKTETKVLYETAKVFIEHLKALQTK